MTPQAQQELDELGMTPERMQQKQAEIAEMLHKEPHVPTVHTETGMAYIAAQPPVVGTLPPQEKPRRAPVKGKCTRCGRYYSAHVKDGTSTEAFCDASRTHIFVAMPPSAPKPSDAPAATPAPAGGITREQAQEVLRLAEAVRSTEQRERAALSEYQDRCIESGRAKDAFRAHIDSLTQ